MTTARSYFTNLLSLFVLLFLHLGCFFFPYNNNAEEQLPPPKRRKVSPSSPSFPVSSNPDAKPLKSFSIRSYLSCILSFRRPRGKDQEPQLHPPGDAPVCPLQPIPLSPDARAGGTQSGGDGKEHVFSGSTAKNDSFASRNDVYPCAACGEVLSKHQLLELHQATKHSLSELCEADSGYNIVRIIFQSGWKGKSPIVHRVLKIHNTTRTLARYEEYRDAVRSRAARYAARNSGGGGGDERCIADGNERLRFYCTTSLCSSDAGRGGDVAPAGVCGSPYCCACAIVRHGFAGKHADLDGIATHATSWGAHGALPQDLEREFAFLGARRAMLVCRVVAGRVAHGHGGGAAEGDEEEEEEGKGAGFDSVVPTGRGGGGGPRDNGVGEDELLVFSPRALLPCFVIMYTT